MSFEMFIVCEFPVLPTVSKVKLPVNLVVDIAEEKLLPADSIVKLPLPVMPDVAAKYVVGSSLTIFRVPALTAVEPVKVLLPLNANIPPWVFTRLAALAPSVIAPEIVLVVELFTVRAPFSLMASDVKAPVVIVRLLSGFVPPTAAFKLT